MGTFNPSDTFRVLLVDPNENPYSLSGIFAMGSFNPSDTARVVLVDPDGNPYKATGGSGGGATIQVNGVDTSDQTLLNFVDTASVTWANPSGGIVEATAITGGTGTVTQVNTTAPITGGPITTTGTIGITQASASVNGFLSSTDWNTFNNKQPAGSYLTAVTSNAPLSGSGTAGSHLVISQSGVATDGYLSSTDWNTFNNKQPAGAYLTAVTADAPLSGSGTSGSHLVISQAGAATDGYLSSTDWNTFNNKVSGPAGSNTEIQYNNSGAFGASSLFKWDTTGTPTVLEIDDATIAANWPNYDATVNSLHSSFFTGLTVAPTTEHNLNVFYTENTSTGGTGQQISNVLTSYWFGRNGAASVGNAIALNANVVVEGNGSSSNEHAAILSVTRSDIGTGYTQSTGPAGAYWGADVTTLGPIAVQPVHLSTGIWNIENFYNGGVTTGKSSGHWITTFPGTGGGMDATHAAATTYPIDVGLGITGASGTSPTPAGLGFTTGIQIGGTGSPWEESLSLIGTGIDISDYATRGIYIHNPTGTPTADIETTGNVIVGGNLTNSVLTASELVGTDASKNLTSVAVGTGLSLSAGTLSATGGGGTVVFSPPGLRLTVVSGDPNPSGNTTAAGTLYWTPDDSGNVWYWDGSAWQVETITEQSLSLTLTSGKNYDVFYLHGTGLVLSSAWTNDTTRADALGTQNGVKVLASDHTKLWIGTIRASGTNVTEDSASKRFVWNNYGQTGRLLSKSSTNSHTYNSTTPRSWDNSTANQVEMVVGKLQTENINLFGDVDSGGYNTVIGAVYAVIDWTSGYGAADDPQVAFGNARLSAAMSAVKQITAGYHYIRAVEAAFNGTATFAQFAITSKFQM